MKLRTKILISILFVSLTTLSVCSYYLVNRNHLDNIAREKERSLNDFTFIMNSLENGIDFQQSNDDLKLLFARYIEYYATREIKLMVYKNNEPYSASFTEIQRTKYNELLTVQKKTRQLQVIKDNDLHYFLVTGKFAEAEEYTLIYARNISNIYELRTQSVYLSLLLAATLILLLGFLSYLYSNWITKPIEVLNRGANSVSEGNYSVRIIPTKDEFNDLGNAFNQMATAVELRTKELEQKAKELQEFIDDLSHEMNTPLTSIQGYSEFLLNANATDVQKLKAADVIRQEARRMKDIYTKLMLITVIREQKPEFVSVLIEKLFSELEASFQLQLQEHNINLELYNDLESLIIDYTLIHMLISNLLKNSIQALPSGGTIQLKAYKEVNSSIIEVSDNGYGIPKDKINEITKPFYRVDKSRSRKTGGAGLGLSICKSIADLHQATLNISSTEGEGTKIKIIFYNSVTTS